MDASVASRARRVRLVVLDADGVLTDGAITISSDGSDARNFYSRDGLGVRMGQRAGLRFAVLSGRSSRAVAARATELDFVACLQGIQEKGGALRELAASCGVPLDEVAYVGDDLVDLPALRLAGLAVAPADAERVVRESVHLVTEAPGGRGAVREVIDAVLRARGDWDRITAAYLGKE